MAHLCLAWVLVEGVWPRVVKFGALIGAVTIALSLFTGVLMLDLSSLVVQVAGLGIELATILATARWDARLFAHAAPESDGSAARAPWTSKVRKVGIAAFRDAEQPSLAASCVLPGNKAEPGGDVPSFCV